MADFSGLHPRDDTVNRRMWYWILADHGNRRGVAAADARRTQDANIDAEDAGQRCEQLVRSRELTRNRITDANGNRWRRSVAFFHNIEVMVKGRHFVHFSHRHLHFRREGDQMRRRQTPEVVLNQVQVFDEEIAAARRVAEQRRYLLSRLDVDCPTFRDRANTPAFAFGLGHWTD